MSGKKRAYSSDEMVVEFDARRCIHAAECVSGLPEVFDPERRPWIDPTQGASAELARVIERCPTGALTYTWRSGADGEQAASKNTVYPQKDGPLHLRGRIRVTMPDGEVLDEVRLALCRCGNSKSMPFCDNSHVEAGFAHDACFVESRLTEREGMPEERLEVSLATNGPILIRGPVEVHSADGESAAGSSGALCRCGLSASKPFCDGSHKAGGFTAE